MASFNAFVERRAADKITVTDDNDEVIAEVPRPQFWTPQQKQIAATGDAPAFWHEVIGVDAFEAVCALTPEHDAQVVGDLLMDYVMDQLGVDLGKLSASSKS